MLCRELNFPHPDYLLPWLTLTQFREWQAHYDSDPWGERRGDLRALAIACLAAGVRNVKPTFPYFEADESPDELADRWARAQAWDRWWKAGAVIWKKLPEPKTPFWEWLNNGRHNHQPTEHSDSGANGAAARRPGQGEPVD